MQVPETQSGLRSSVNEAFLEDDCEFRDIKQLIAEKENRVNELEAWMQDYDGSGRTSADEGIGLDDDKTEKKALVENSMETENREMIEMKSQRNKKDQGKTRLFLDQSSDHNSGNCEETV